jgi:CAAX prenyl protease-like protein
MESSTQITAPPLKSTSPTLAYVLPFGVFIALLALQQIVPIPQWVRFAAPLIVIAFYSRQALGTRLVSPLASIAMGIAVCAFWVGPEIVFPGYHHHWLFSNGLLGHPDSTATAAQKSDQMFILFRILVLAITVPILEELFWRGWLMRWLIDRNFQKIPLGTYDRQAFWIVAALFASEHGSFWDVGLLTGVIYNWWMIRTKSLWDCILMHAVTNACLAWYVLHYDQWMYLL